MLVGEMFSLSLSPLHHSTSLLAKYIYFPDIVYNLCVSGSCCEENVFVIVWVIRNDIYVVIEGVGGCALKLMQLNRLLPIRPLMRFCTPERRCSSSAAAWLISRKHTDLIFSPLCSEFIGENGDEKFWQFVNTVKELTVYKHGGGHRTLVRSSALVICF